MAETQRTNLAKPSAIQTQKQQMDHNYSALDEWTMLNQSRLDRGRLDRRVGAEVELKIGKNRKTPRYLRE